MSQNLGSVASSRLVSSQGTQQDDDGVADFRPFDIDISNRFGGIGVQCELL